ncbi:hypothetical protein BBW68_10355 [Candidatus Erwinia dacicola]|uniref:Transposase IS801/IS1294 domain-containing protein n=1 Tax=Candidatus Erwinia dacicola TaxID=252393 RepID=A0A1E7Z0D6_9GAMM|nr:hypothetical protein BBW68_10355 [Candidatus Erwinia dacicola]
MRYRSHGTKQEEALTLSGDEFMARFSWHVPEKRFWMVRYYGFLSPSKRSVLDVMYPLACIMCGKMMCFSGLKRGLRVPKLLACHEKLAQMKICG